MPHLRILRLCGLSLLINLSNSFVPLTKKNSIKRILLQSLLQSANARSQVSPIIIGAGPAGLATAIMLARRGYRGIKVYDRLPRPPSPGDTSIWNNFDVERSYNLGLSSRGQLALTQLDVMDRVKRYSQEVIGRKEWTASLGEPTEELYPIKDYKTYVLQRDRLTGALLEEIIEKYGGAVSVNFNTACLQVEWSDLGQESERCRLHLKSTEFSEPVFFKDSSSFVIGADGANSVIRDAIEQQSEKSEVRAYKFEDKNVRVYRTVSLHIPSDGLFATWKKDLNLSVRLSSDLNLECLPTKEGVYLGVLIYRPNDARIAALKTVDDARAFFATYFPMFTPCLRPQDLEKFVLKDDSFFPKFSFVGPKLHFSRSVCLLGDCIHSVKPFFGLGANSAIEDILSLDKSLASTGDSIPKAVAMYSDTRGKEARAVVEISRSLDGGFLTFVVPLIMDALFHKALPWIFNPNVLQCLNDETRTFTEIQRRKRVDRGMQLIAIASSMAWLMRKMFSLGLKILF